MKFITAILLTAILSYIAGIYLPWWWSFVPVAFIVALLVHQKPMKAFCAGFISMFLLWGGLAYWINIKNDGMLATKIAELLPLGGSDYLLILVTGVVAGLIAGLAALSGSFLRSTPGK